MKVRIYGYNGIRMVPKHLPQDYSVDSVQVLDEPYLWVRVLETADLAPVDMAPVLDDRAKIVRIEIPDGEKIRYEINPPTRPGGVLQASVSSPMLVGVDQFYWGSGWTISVIDARNAL